MQFITNIPVIPQLISRIPERIDRKLNIDNESKIKTNSEIGNF
jgi:hypothetical protein